MMIISIHVVFNASVDSSIALIVQHCDKMFWHSLYVKFKKRFTSSVRGLFGLILTSFVLMTLQSFEGASINDKLPVILWADGLAAHFGMDTQPLPTYADVYLHSLPQVDELKAFLDKVRDLDNWKLILLPVALNTVDVVVMRRSFWSCMQQATTIPQVLGGNFLYGVLR